MTTDRFQCSPVAPVDPLRVNAEDFAALCKQHGTKGGYAGGIERYRTLYRSGDATAVGAAMGELMPTPTKIVESMSGEGVVRKFLLPLKPAEAGVYDRAATGATLETESVIIPMIGKKRILTHTLCVSSQVGCAMGCGFCQTAQMGLVRNLTAREIVQQWFAARHLIPGYQDDRPGCPSIRNIVFMGMGEPMDNLEAVIEAIAILTDRNGANIPMSKVTISTVGRVDGITRLAEQVNKDGWHRLNLAISLNAPNDDVRSQIMPISKKYALDELRTALERWPIYGAAKLCIEYVLIPGVNDAREHAQEVGDFVVGRGKFAGRPALDGLVNLIPYNPREHSPWPAPSEAHVDEFLAWLTDAGCYAKRRRTKGRDQMAACGQLGNLEHRRRTTRVGAGPIPITVSRPG